MIKQIGYMKQHFSVQKHKRIYLKMGSDYLTIYNLNFIQCIKQFINYFLNGGIMKDTGILLLSFFKILRYKQFTIISLITGVKS